MSDALKTQQLVIGAYYNYGHDETRYMASFRDLYDIEKGWTGDVYTDITPASLKRINRLAANKSFDVVIDLRPYALESTIVITRIPATTSGLGWCATHKLFDKRDADGLCPFCLGFAGTCPAHGPYTGSECPECEQNAERCADWQSTGGF